MKRALMLLAVPLALAANGSVAQVSPSEAFPNVPNVFSDLTVEQFTSRYRCTDSSLGALRSDIRERSRGDIPPALEQLLVEAEQSNAEISERPECLNTLYEIAVLTTGAAQRQAAGLQPVRGLLSGLTVDGFMDRYHCTDAQLGVLRSDLTQAAGGDLPVRVRRLLNEAEEENAELNQPGCTQALREIAWAVTDDAFAGPSFTPTTEEIPNIFADMTVNQFMNRYYCTDGGLAILRGDVRERTQGDIPYRIQWLINDAEEAYDDFELPECEHTLRTLAELTTGAADTGPFFGGGQ